MWQNSKTQIGTKLKNSNLKKEEKKKKNLRERKKLQ